MTTFLKPLIITHINVKSSDDRNLIINLCAKTLHMSKGEVKLLHYYSKQQIGFRPSAQHIANETNLCKKSIFNLRNKLVEHGVVKIQNDRIYIDWNRLRLFSTLDPKLTGKNPYIQSVTLRRETKHFYLTTDLYYFLMYGKLEDVCKYFSNTTEEEYKSCCQKLKKRIERENSHYFNVDNNHEDII